MTLQNCGKLRITNFLRNECNFISRLQNVLRKWKLEFETRAKNQTKKSSIIQLKISVCVVQLFLMKGISAFNMMIYHHETDCRSESRLM